jgi:hypothetical protein
MRRAPDKPGDSTTLETPPPQPPVLRIPLFLVTHLAISSVRAARVIVILRQFRLISRSLNVNWNFIVIGTFNLLGYHRTAIHMTAVVSGITRECVVLFSRAAFGTGE